MKIELVFNPQTKTWADPISNGKKVQYSTVKGDIEVRKNLFWNFEDLSHN